MKILFYLQFIIFISCKDSANSNYKLIKVDSNSTKNIIATKYYVDISDTNKKMNIYFWDNGKVMTKAYLKGKLQDGDWEFFSITGELKSVLTFKNGALVKRIEYDSLGNLITK
jgi:antitoxin component YwqK of YwqJK toxin-antitoxin module